MAAVAPGVDVRTRADLTPTGTSGDTGRLFAAGVTVRGPLEPTVVRGVSDFEGRFGGRTNYATLADPLRAFFSNGGAEAIIARVVGPAAEAASATVVDEITYTAVEPGESGNDLSVVVEDEGATLRVLDDGDEVERFGGLESIADAVAALQASRYIRGEDESTDGTGMLSEGTEELSGGDDDRANISSTEWSEALDRFGAEWGPGQVAAPGYSEVDADLVTHAEERNRIALLAPDEGASVGDLDTLGEQTSDRAALVGYWVRMRLGGRLRSVPGTMPVAGRIARRDAGVDTAHLAAAGDPNGALDGVVELIQADVDDDDRDRLTGDGVNLAVERPGGRVLNYGWRTAAGQDSPFRDLAVARYRMALEARVAQVAERFLFKGLTPSMIARFGSQIRGILLDDFNAGALFGESPDEAFAVDVDDVNTADTIAAQELRAAVAVTPTPTAERVLIDIVRRNVE